MAKKAKKKAARRKTTRKKAKARRKRGASAPKKKTRRRSSAARGSLGKVSTSALEAELARRESRVDGVRRERDKVASRLAELDAELSRLGASAGRGRRAGRGGGGKRPRNDMNLADSLASVLKGTKMSVTELSEAVQAAGYRTTSPNFRTIVNQTLIKDPKRFKKVSRGIYTV